MSWNVYTRVPLNTSITVTTLNSLQYSIAGTVFEL